MITSVTGIGSNTLLWVRSFVNLSNFILMAVYTGKTLLRRYKGAVADRNMQREAHRGFTASLPPDLVGGWGAMCARWDADGFPKSVPNPFNTTDASEFCHPIRM